MMTPATGSRLENQPPALTVSLPLTEAQADKIGLGDRWRTAAKKITTRQRSRADSKARLEAAIATLLQRAAREEWSQRELARKVQIPWTCFLRCRNGSVNPANWLPRIEAAAAKLT